MQQRFVSDVSHELRTPLTTVRMAAEVLYEAREDFDPVVGPVGRADADRAGPVRGAAHRPAGDLPVRRRGGRAQRRRGRPAATSSTGCVEAHALLAESHGVTHHACTAAGEAKAEVDARRIERILRNLLVNAIEHSEGKPIDILIASDQLAVAVAVRDHGVGFEASQAKQVFHRFWRADPARARTVGGSGLGLAIAMEDANLHGGWLTAWGRPGLGAQFRLTLPRRLGHGAADLAAAAGAPRPGARPSRTRVPPSRTRRRADQPAEIGRGAAGAGRRGRRVGRTRPRRGGGVPMSGRRRILGPCWSLWSCCWPCSPAVSRCRPRARSRRSRASRRRARTASTSRWRRRPPATTRGRSSRAYLRATSNYQPNYSVARQFLTRRRPSSGVRRTGSRSTAAHPRRTRTSVILDGRLVGSLAPDRTYTAQDKELEVGLRPGPGGRGVADQQAAERA